MPSKPMKQSRLPQTDVRENLAGDTYRHTLNYEPDSAQAAGGGMTSPNSAYRGPQAQYDPKGDSKKMKKGKK